MKGLMYISELTSNQSVSAMRQQCANALNAALRHSDADQSINGIMSFKDGYFFQCIEGPGEKIDELMRYLFSDPSQNHFNIFVNKKASKRNFANSSLRLVSNVKQDLEFRNFVAEHSHNLNHMPSEKMKILKRFLSPSRS